MKPAKTKRTKKAEVPEKMVSRVEVPNIDPTTFVNFSSFFLLVDKINEVITYLKDKEEHERRG